MDLQRYNQALLFATKAHAKQSYKSSNEIPYISHPYFVGTLLEREGFDEDTVIAGLLHDTVEDTEATLDDVRRAFGERVASIVAEVTYDQSKPFSVRFPEALARIPTSSPEAKAVKAADIYSHMLTYLGNKVGNQGMHFVLLHTPEKLIEKYQRTIDALSVGWQHPLLDLTKEVFEEFKAYVPEGPQAEKK